MKAGIDRIERMSVIDLLKKGLGYLLMSMGVSSPSTRRAPRPKPAPAAEAKKPE